MIADRVTMRAVVPSGLETVKGMPACLLEVQLFGGGEWSRA